MQHFPCKNRRLSRLAGANRVIDSFCNPAVTN